MHHFSELRLDFDSCTGEVFLRPTLDLQKFRKGLVISRVIRGGR
jgi:hypothetical protein